jgi:TolB-like protein/DNA-binding winged helix-turn-helix (wHTH) protein/Tfp pilus assembly protein PilF
VNIKNTNRPAILLVLAIYAVSCFVVVQFLDMLPEPLSVPSTAIRWVTLAMLAVAPILVIWVAWRSRRETRSSRGAAVEPGQDVVFRIEHAELDTARRELRFNGAAVDVQPKVFDLLEYLVRARDRVVGKDELFDNIWPSVIVSEASLTQSVKRVRDLFRQNGFDNEVIRTVARKGYKFACSAETGDVVVPEASSVWSDVVLPAAAVGALAVALGYFVWNWSPVRMHMAVPSDAANSLVVLPFANLTPDQKFRYFSDGLTETVTNSLTTVRNLRVIARGSAFSFRDAQPDYPTIGRELNVAHIVEGSVQRNENELRVSARLIRADDGEQIWSQIYSRAFDDVFAMQDDISRSIVDQMSILLARRLVFANDSKGEIDKAASAEAYRLLLLGLDQRKMVSATGLKAAEENFRAALTLLPEYPQAMHALADVLRVRAVIGELPREPAFAEALALIRRTLELNPDFADAYVTLGEIQHRHFWNFADAAKSYQRALELNPGNAGVHSAYSRFLSKSGEFERSIGEAEIALDLDPKSTQAATSLAIRQIRARKLDAARSVIDALSSRYSGHADLPWLETNWHIRNGSYRDALQWAALEELDYLRLSLSAIALYYLDRTEQAREVLEELIRSDPDGAAFQIAEVYAHWNEADSAFEWLERAYSQGDPGLAELYSSANLENLHEDSRFPVLAERIGLPPLPPR